MPPVAKLAPRLTGWDAVMTQINKMRGVILETVKDHEKTFVDDGNPRDFIDAYIKEWKSTTNPKSSFYKEVGGKNSKN